MKDKKTLLIILVLALCIGLSACNASPTTATDISAISEVPSKEAQSDTVVSNISDLDKHKDESTTLNELTTSTTNESTTLTTNKSTTSTTNESNTSTTNESTTSTTNELTTLIKENIEFDNNNNSNKNNNDEINTPNVNNIKLEQNEYGLELPINGATGYASIKLPLYLNDKMEGVNTVLNPGTAFTILEENKNMWFVKVSDNLSGWVDHTYCMINLPDVIPSIIYNNTNSYQSLFRSVGNNIEGITNKQLYNARGYSNRFANEQFMVPVLYSMSPKICVAQHEALKNGNTLIIYEGFRPYQTQMQICNALQNLAAINPEVASHINNSTWSINWFISTNVSNHQRGYAIDVSLGKVVQSEFKNCGTHVYESITNYNEYQMPTPIHELSDLSATFRAPVSSKSRDAWKSAKLASSMNEEAILLQKYCTESGLTPLASEWWHFNDLDALASLGNNLSDGNFYITENKSEIPTE